MKCGHARVFSRTLLHGNSKNQIGQITGRRLEEQSGKEVHRAQEKEVQTALKYLWPTVPVVATP